MATVYLATLGQRPEAITVAFDVLSEQYRFAEIGILHTEPQVSGITEAYHDLRAILDRDYPHLSARWHTLVRGDGSPIVDIESQAAANHYYEAVLDILAEYKRQGYTLHLMVAGGRKAMSIYATLAAATLFGSQDRVWTVLSPQYMLDQPGQFHVPVGAKHHVQLVQLPLMPARLLGTNVPQDTGSYLRRRQDLRADFFSKLSQAEQEIAEAFTQHPYHTNEELAEVLSKSKRTVDNQFASIYRKLPVFLDYVEQGSDKRALLRDLLLGRY